MPYFSETSKKRLRTCHPDLQRLFNEVIKTYDCSIIWGHRDKKAQDKAFEDGYSKVRYPNSKHNREPSEAVDAVPYIPELGGATWKERPLYFFAGYVKRLAEELNIAIRCGADWDSDENTEDQSLRDPAHFELILYGRSS